jgi:hypothetical protein
MSLNLLHLKRNIIQNMEKNPVEKAKKLELPQQYGGKKRRTLKKGGEGEELELPQQYGGKKHRTLKKGGEGEELELPQQYGGKKRRTLKKGGEGEELELPQQYGGKKHRTLKKGGGNEPPVPVKTEQPIAPQISNSDLLKSLTSANSTKMTGGKKNKTMKKSCLKFW